MKKLLSVMLALVLALTVAACGEKDIHGTQIDGNSQTEQNPFSMGKVEGLLYENKFIGIGCKLDSAWSFKTEEEIREANNITAEMVGEEYEELLKNAASLFDMNAIHSNQMDNIIVVLEKVNPLQLAVLDLKTNFEKQIPMIRDAFENMGYTDVEFETGTVNIGGKDFDAMTTTGQISGFAICQVAISIKCDGYLATVTITTYETSMEEMLKCFYLT